jgi:hypothetical protein
MQQKDEPTPSEPARHSKESSDSIPADVSESLGVVPAGSTPKAESPHLLDKQKREGAPRSRPARPRTGAVTQSEVTIKDLKKEESADMPLPTDTGSKQPLVIDLGSISRKDAKRLKQGNGRAIYEAQRASELAKSSGAPDAPIILLYRRKTRRRRVRFPFPFPFPSL